MSQATVYNWVNVVTLNVAAMSVEEKPIEELNIQDTPVTWWFPLEMYYRIFLILWGLLTKHSPAVICNTTSTQNKKLQPPPLTRLTHLKNSSSRPLCSHSRGDKKHILLTSLKWYACNNMSLVGPLWNHNIYLPGEGTLKTRNWTSRDLTMRHHIAGVDNARPDNMAPYGRSGHRETRQHGTIWQGWTSRDVKMRSQIKQRRC